LQTLIATTTGIALIALALRDIIRELFAPENSGSVSRLVMHGVWRFVRVIAKRRRSALYHAGPVILVAVAAAWTLMLVLGWALIYWPRLPRQFNLAPGLPEAASHGFMTAVFVSGATLTSLGSSALTPTASLLRVLYVFEGLVGLVMITAWITWTLSIYPVIADRRSFTREILLLRAATPPASVREPPLEATAEILRSLTERLLRVGAQLRQTRVTYYFQNEAPEVALTSQLPWVLDYARAAETQGPEPAIRGHGMLLRTAVEQMVGELGEHFLDIRDAPPEEVIARLAEDHLLPKPGKIRQRATGRTGV
jgi:hypothetical protein